MFINDTGAYLMQALLHHLNTNSQLKTPLRFPTTRWMPKFKFNLLHNVCFGYKHLFIIISIQPFLGAGLTGTRAQSGDRYGSGTLHSRQVLRGSLPLLSPAFRRSNFRRQMPPRPHQRENS
jgi:hypothetical protein